jgi:hypothetical protein
MVPPELYVDGSNRIEILEVTETGELRHMTQS